MSYTIGDHKHRFYAWSASRAASVKGCRFKVERGQAILDESGLRNLIDNPWSLPSPEEIDAMHRAWRERIINIAKEQCLTFTHGVAAKLINVYLKAAFVCGGYDAHPNVNALHPSDRQRATRPAN